MKPLREILESSMKPLRESREFKEQMIALKWRESVGEQVDRRTVPQRLVGQTLHVHVASSVWATQLQALKSQILKELNSRIRPLKVKDLRFQVQYPLRKPRTLSERPDDLEELPPKSTPLPEETVRKIEETVGSLDEDSLKAVIESVMTKDGQLREYRKSLGWKPCSGCGVFVKKRELCPFCSLHGTPETADEGEQQTQSGDERQTPHDDERQNS